MNKKLFEYAILWHPTESQVKEKGLKSLLLKSPDTVLAGTVAEVNILASKHIDAKYEDQLDQIEIAVRPF